jgi:hypothetical protein
MTAGGPGENSNSLAAGWSRGNQDRRRSCDTWWVVRLSRDSRGYASVVIPRGCRYRGGRHCGVVVKKGLQTPAGSKLRLYAVSKNGEGFFTY